MATRTNGQVTVIKSDQHSKDNDMRKRTSTAIIGIMAAAAISITACGSNGNEGTPTNPVPPTTQQATPAGNAGATPTLPTPTTDSGRLHKNPGDKAGFTGAQGPVLTFTVDSINTSTTCEGSGTKPGTPQGQFLNVNMTVTADSDMPTELTNALAESYWAVVDSNGVTQTDITTYECFKNDSSKLAHIQAGNTYKLNVIFDVPTDAQALVFQADSTNANGWEWDIH